MSIINEKMLYMTATTGMRLEALKGQADLACKLSNIKWLKMVASSSSAVVIGFIDICILFRRLTRSHLRCLPPVHLPWTGSHHTEACRRCSCRQAIRLLNHRRGRGDIVCNFFRGPRLANYGGV